LFQAYPSTTFWKIQLNGTSGNYYATNELILKINELPINGTCQVITNLTGLALETFFTISCFNWIDPDVYIYSYKFFGKKLL
jgi:hypothetical protein